MPATFEEILLPLLAGGASQGGRNMLDKKLEDRRISGQEYQADQAMDRQVNVLGEQFGFQELLQEMVDKAAADRQQSAQTHTTSERKGGQEFTDDVVQPHEEKIAGIHATGGAKVKSKIAQEERDRAADTIAELFPDDPRVNKWVALIKTGVDVDADTFKIIDGLMGQANMLMNSYNDLNPITNDPEGLAELNRISSEVDRYLGGIAGETTTPPAGDATVQPLIEGWDSGWDAGYTAWVSESVENPESLTEAQQKKLQQAYMADMTSKESEPKPNKILQKPEG